MVKSVQINIYFYISLLRSYRKAKPIIIRDGLIIVIVYRQEL